METKKLFFFVFFWNFVSELQFFEYQNKKKGGRLSTIAIYARKREASIKIILITWRFLLSLDVDHMIELLENPCLKHLIFYCVMVSNNINWNDLIMLLFLLLTKTAAFLFKFTRRLLKKEESKSEHCRLSCGVYILRFSTYYL